MEHERKRLIRSEQRFIGSLDVDDDMDHVRMTATQNVGATKSIS